jgi:hypothetical protein
MRRPLRFVPRRPDGARLSFRLRLRFNIGRSSLRWSNFKPADHLLYTVHALRIFQRSHNFIPAGHVAAERDDSLFGIDADLPIAKIRVGTDPSLNIAGDLRITAWVVGGIALCALRG